MFEKEILLLHYSGLIGIGTGLAARLLPQHLAYGSRTKAFPLRLLHLGLQAVRTYGLIF